MFFYQTTSRMLETQTSLKELINGQVKCNHWYCYRLRVIFVPLTEFFEFFL